MTQHVAIQGIRGSYHEIAARKYYRQHENRAIGIFECKNFPDVVAAVRDGHAFTGMLAIENSIAGSLLQNHELVRKSGLDVLGEYELRISHCLVALPGTKPGEVDEVASHPMALLQCEKFLETLWPKRVVEKDDTASSALWIAENRKERHAAICSREAAEAYGLDVLAEAIETDPHNYTRFLLLGRRNRNTKTSGEIDKALLVFSLAHTVGSLSQVLAVFSFYGMNLTKIQSFPIAGETWRYLFYVDLAFSDASRYRQALDAAAPLTQDMKVLGEY